MVIVCPRGGIFSGTKLFPPVIPCASGLQPLYRAKGMLDILLFSETTLWEPTLSFYGGGIYQVYKQ